MTDQRIELIRRLELIKRLEAATGPDRQLDWDILEAWADPFSPDSPRYTESVDAALTLVPKGYDWIIAHTNSGLTIHACCGDTKEHFADTPAIALCIAALKARTETDAVNEGASQNTRNP